MESVLRLVICLRSRVVERLVFICGAHKESLKVHRLVAGIGFPPPFPSPGTHSCAWINGANEGFDRTNSHWLMNHSGHWILLMFQLK